MPSANRSLSAIFRRHPMKTKDVVADVVVAEKPSASVAISAADSETELRKLVNKFKKACEKYHFRQDKDIFSETVSLLAAAKKFSMVEEVLDHQKSYDDIRSEAFAARLILLYGKAGMFDHARKVFDELPELNCPRGIVSFNALLKAAIVSHNYDALLAAFEDLPHKVSVEPDSISYNIVVCALCKSGDVDRALSILSESEKSGEKPDLLTFNTILSALYRDGRFAEGDSLFASMESRNVIPNVVSYNAKLRGIFRHDAELMAAVVVSEMESKGIKPNLLTYNLLIGGYCNRGDLITVVKLFDELQRRKFRPNIMTYKLIIPAFCKEGDHETAFKICLQAINERVFVTDKLFWEVVDGLAMKKKTDKARKLVELVNSAEHLNYKLESPVV